MVDVLSDIFETIRLRGTLYFRTDYSPPWAITVPSYAKAARFHLVVQGRCHISLPSGQIAELGAGDLILIPRGQTHVLADSPGQVPAPLEQVIRESGFTGKGAFALGKGDSGASTQMVCGHFSFSEGADHPLLRALPDMIVMRAGDRARQPLLDNVLRLVAQCAFSETMGASTAISRLSEVCFIEIIRACIGQSERLPSILEAMTDPQIGRALELIHGNPAKPWTVESLALEVGMSRSRFAERFSQLMGVGPMSYLSDWRLQRALVLLGQPHVNIQTVAARIGYLSAAAFTRAFAHKFGSSPSDFRRLDAHNMQIVS